MNGTFPADGPCRNEAGKCEFFMDFRAAKCFIKTDGKVLPALLTQARYVIIYAVCGTRQG